MAIVAKISRLRIRPYEPQEIALMEAAEYERIKASGYEKILGEEVVQEFVAEDLGQLSEKVSRIVEDCKPDPIIVQTPGTADEPSVKHSFLINRGYLSDDVNGIFETIIFRPKNSDAYRERMRKLAKESEFRRATAAEQKEFVDKAFNSAFEQFAETFPSSYEKTLKQLGFANNDEFRAYFVNLESKRGDFATEQKFHEYCASEWEKRMEPARAHHREELLRKPPYWAGLLPKTLNDEMTVLCRIIGKDRETVYKHHHYYRRCHNISDPAFSVDNHADDGLETSFVYRK